MAEMYGDKIIIHEKWNQDEFSFVTTYSEREYIVYETMAAQMESDYGSPRNGRAVTLTLFIDVLTGVVVYDIETYERSLNE